MSPRRLINALEASLKRLGAETLDLYFIHFPFTFLSTRALMDVMAQAVRSGQIRAVGVSNYNAPQMRDAAECLSRHKIPLAANQVQYSLLHRRPEANGVLEACRELDVALMAYRPLASGAFTALMTPDRTDPAATWLGRTMTRRALRKGTPEQVTALAATLMRTADAHGASVSQVALNWLLQRDDHVIPIPGATSARHARDNADTLTWTLSNEEFVGLDHASAPWST